MLSEYLLNILRLLIEHAGVMRRGPKGWHIEGRRDTISNSDVGRLHRGAYLKGKRRSGIATITAQGRRAATDSGHVPPIGTEVVVRDTGYKSPGVSRYMPCRVLRATPDGRIVIAVTSAGWLYLATRPHVSAHWKACGPIGAGYFAPGGHHHDADLWARILTLPGALPARWSQPDAGEPHTLARLRSVRERLACIHASPVNVEERAAMALFHYAEHEHDLAAISRIRQTIGYHRTTQYTVDRSEAVADYLTAVVVNDATEVEAAEATEVRSYTWRIYEHERSVARDQMGWRKAFDLPLPSLVTITTQLRKDGYIYSDDAIRRGYDALAEDYKIHRQQMATSLSALNTSPGGERT